MASIESLNRATDQLAEVCETALHGIAADPTAKVIHVAFRGLENLPLDMVTQLGALK